MKILALDVGGTAVKYGVFCGGEERLGQFAVKDETGKDGIVSRLLDFCGETQPDFLAVSTPGPFDYTTGTSLMKHKLHTLFGVSLKDLFAQKLPQMQVCFMNDATAFALGVLEEKPQLKTRDVACVMLGTGLGYANVRHGIIQLNDSQTPSSPLWNMPFLDGISENYVSTRALLQAAKEKGYTFSNIKDMADEARRGNQALADVFYHFGRYLGLCLKQKRSDDHFDEVVIGGQISKSFDLMKAGFESALTLPHSLVRDTATCALYGLYGYTNHNK